MSNEPQWLEWAKELQAVAQIGLHFCQDPYDRERYEQMQALAARMMSEQSGHGYARILELFAGQTGYATPKVDVRGAIIRDGKILMVRELSDGGRWTLPGGWADVNKSPSESVIKEVWEETGYEAVVTKLAAVYDRAKHPHHPPHPFHVYKLFFLCDIVGGEPKASLETDMPTFFAEDDIPILSEARTLPFQIKRMFAHTREPGLACEYD